MKLWTWLKDPANRAVLGFLGAGVAAAAALLVQAGFGPRTDPAPPLPKPEIRAEPGQQAQADAQGVATNIRGDGNQVRIQTSD
ncbi:hypothetical protein K6V92_00780 [Cupriavidus respiraculi]|uniref:hypothetical protein n=1 Tax=Cupriavidus respiraculi TaxID=195930 RepID=UPI001C93F153|nr:hypothetical protein [Cupriavidus respiraculi]MBY4945160.1 hypothetical protein [Cupriavidus respiraculi]